MRNSLLQYLYTILVFSGALTTSYLMLAQSELRNQTRTAQNLSSEQGYRREAGLDSAVTRLFETENALSDVPQTDRIPALDPRDRTKAPSQLQHSTHSTGERSNGNGSAEFEFLR